MSGNDEAVARPTRLLVAFCDVDSVLAGFLDLIYEEFIIGVSNFVT
jgi:hypothetical protein